MYHCAIIGAGAVGGLIAAKLSQNHNKVCFVDRRLSESSQLELELEQWQGAKLQFKLPYLNQLAPCRWLIICVKAHQVAQAIEGLSIAADCQVLLMVNGIGAEQSLLSTLKPEQLFLASNTHGALLIDRQAHQLRVKHTGLGKIDLGGYLNQVLEPQYLAYLNQAFEPVYWHNNIYPVLWQKLAINCCINPLTAIHRCRNGELLKPQYQSEITHLCAEISHTAALEGIALSEQQLQQSVLQVAKLTANNFSSMQQDLIQQRRSEIDYINGYLVECAKRHGLDTPCNLALLQRIKQMEQDYA